MLLLDKYASANDGNWDGCGGRHGKRGEVRTCQGNPRCCLSWAAEVLLDFGDFKRQNADVSSQVERGHWGRQVRQVRQARYFRNESRQHFCLWGWLDVNGRLTSTAPHSATSTPLEAGFRVK